MLSGYAQRPEKHQLIHCMGNLLIPRIIAIAPGFCWPVITNVSQPILPTWPSKTDHMSRNDSMRNKDHALPPIIFKLVGVLSLAAFILVIVGQTQNSDITRGVIMTETKVALILFLVVWVVLCGLFLFIANRSRSIADGEHRLLLAVGISIPLLLVRLIYSLIYAFGNMREFNILLGNVTIQLVMSVLEEIVIVLVCLGIGLTLEVRPSTEDGYDRQSDIHDRGISVEMGNNGQPGREPNRKGSQKRKFRGGPISWLVMLIVDEIKSRRNN